MKSALKRLAAALPSRWQQELKRRYFQRQIRRGGFRTDEPEYDLLDTLVEEGDWVLDIGANIGHYTARLSQLVGARGRVIAFEPVPETFELLAANVSAMPQKNVTLINAAASDATRVLGMEIPMFATGLDNLYMARVADDRASLQVLCLDIDAFNLPARIKLAKIDVEGHELSVLSGMRKILERDHPILIVEVSSPQVDAFLEPLGYTSRALPGSPNHIFQPA